MIKKDTVSISDDFEDFVQARYLGAKNLGYRREMDHAQAKEDDIDAHENFASLLVAA